MKRFKLPLNIYSYTAIFSQFTQQFMLALVFQRFPVLDEVGVLLHNKETKQRSYVSFFGTHKMKSCSLNRTEPNVTRSVQDPH